MREGGLDTTCKPKWNKNHGNRVCGMAEPTSPYLAPHPIGQQRDSQRAKWSGYVW